MSKQTVFGIIPARGGSIGIPRKNIVPLLGRPLLHYTCEAALASKTLDRVILSTDDEEIAAVGRSGGVDVPFLRPLSLAQSSSTSVEVVLHALDWFKAGYGHLPDVVVLLQPTSPLRNETHIDDAVSLFLEHRPDTVFSVLETPHHLNPISAWRKNGESFVPFLENEGARILRSQDKPQAYAPNGAIYVTGASYVVENRSIFGDSVVPYVMPPEQSIDIEIEFDLAVAAAALNFLAGSTDLA